MSVAVAVEDGPRCPTVDGLVAVRGFGFARFGAGCSCGWAGKRRLLKAAAEQDAWMHAIHRNCRIAVPLVRPSR